MKESQPPLPKSPEPPPTGAGPAMAPIAGPAEAPAEAIEKRPERETIPPTQAAHSRVLPVLYFLGFAILAGAIGWMWQNPPQPPQAPTGALQARLETVEARLARLEARPPETRPPETRLPETRPAPAFDPAPLLARIAALESRPPAASAPANVTSPNPPPPNLAPLEARIAALESRPAASPPDAALSERVGRMARIQAAATALEAGHRLGNLPGAPPALLRFADADPPTEAALRLAFPDQARAATLASRPIDPGLPWLSRIWGRLQELITIRQGERVLVGDPAAGVLAAARRALEAGDLAGAVAALERLNPPAEQAMSGWIEPAKSLLQARAALAEMAARG